MKNLFKVAVLMMPFGVSQANIDSVPITQLEERQGVVYELYDDQPFTGRAVSRFFDGTIRSEVYFKDGLKNGVEKTWFQNGALRKSFEYREGERHGEWTSWDENQRVLFHRNYDKGIRSF